MSTEHPTVPRKTLRKHASLKRQDSDENLARASSSQKVDPMMPYDVKVVTISANQKAQEDFEKIESPKLTKNSLENIDKNYDENTTDLRKRVEEWLTSSSTSSSQSYRFNARNNTNEIKQNNFLTFFLFKNRFVTLWKALSKLKNLKFQSL